MSQSTPQNSTANQDANVNIATAEFFTKWIRELERERTEAHKHCKAVNRELRDARGKPAEIIKHVTKRLTDAYDRREVINQRIQMLKTLRGVIRQDSHTAGNVALWHLKESLRELADEVKGMFTIPAADESAREAFLNRSGRK